MKMYPKNLPPQTTQVGAYNTYVGARYVPIFGGEWDATKAYEPLTIVTRQGNSYTSKQYVPKNVDINNTDYWALTGNFNGQLSSLEEMVSNNSVSINTINNEITSITQEIATLKTKTANRFYVIVADSYGDRPTNAYSFTDFLPQYMDKNSFFVTQNSGAGFNTTTVPSFTELLDNVPNDIRDNVTDVAVETALNDYNNNKTEWVSGINAFKSKCNELFPNLRTIHIMPVIISAARIPKKNQFFSMLQDVNIKNIKSPRSYNWIHNAMYLVSDNLHLSELGAKELAKLVAFYLQDMEIQGDLYSSNYAITSNITVTSWTEADTIGVAIKGTLPNAVRGRETVLGSLPAYNTPSSLLKSNNNFIICGGCIYSGTESLWATFNTKNGDLVMNTLANLTQGSTYEINVVGRISSFYN